MPLYSRNIKASLFSKSIYFFNRTMSLINASNPILRKYSQFVYEIDPEENKRISIASLFWENENN